MQPLPIDASLPELIRALRGAPAVVVEAPPGAGKTTRVPSALLAAGLAGEGEIVVAQPRRLAARLAARWVAEEQGEPLGRTIGYSVRFEDVSSAATRVRYVTDGVLLRRLIADPMLGGVRAVVLDEFHERRLPSEVSLTLLRRLQKRRDDLALVVMSATLAAGPICSYLDDCPRVRCEGRRYAVDVEHLEHPDDRPLDKQVVSAVKRLVREEADGDVLVFLPGAVEIRRAEQGLEPFAREQGLRVLPLHGDMPLAVQARAVEPAAGRKVVLATNVAESSVTIDGVTGVVDAGVARTAVHSPWTGVPRLTISKISRASAHQRAGRAGRTRPGRVLRLYTRGDHDGRPEHDTAELQRLDLAETALLLHGAGVADPASLSWLEPPPAVALEAAEQLLGQLGAVAEGQLTATGERMLRFAVHPRLARVLVEAERRGLGPDGCVVVALLGERDIRRAARTRFGPGHEPQPLGPSGPSDVLELAALFDEARAARFSAHALRSLDLDERTLRAVERARRRLERLVRRGGEAPPSTPAHEEALGRCLLTGFVDRLARRRRPHHRELILASGATARLSPTSVVSSPAFMVAIDVDDRSAAGRSGSATVRLASAVEPEWLVDEHAELLAATDELVWNDERGRVEQLGQIRCGSVVLEESRTAAPPSARAAELLCAAVVDHHTLDDELAELFARCALVGEHLPEAELPLLDETAVPELVARACAGLTSRAELAGIRLADWVRAEHSPDQQRLLDEAVPRRIALPGGRRLQVHYERGRPPWVESRLQDFFGMAQGPVICRGRAPLTLHLLAPNRRAVQVTQDLAGFWERHYPAIRRQLRRRYPKHPWPEDGRTAKPPPPGRRRPRKS